MSCPPLWGYEYFLGPHNVIQYCKDFLVLQNILLILIVVDTGITQCLESFDHIFHNTKKLSILLITITTLLRLLEKKKHTVCICDLFSLLV